MMIDNVLISQLDASVTDFINQYHIKIFFYEPSDFFPKNYHILSYQLQFK
jgi:hypothetical protein